MGSKIIGIEVGSDTLKMAVVKDNTVLKMAIERMPQNLVVDGRVTSADAMVRFLRGMMKKHGIRGNKCAMVLPPPTVVAQQVSLPVMSETELKLNLPFEFRDYVGKEIDKYEYDYIVQNLTNNRMELYAAACRKELVENYYAIFKKAGMTLKAAMPAEMAWLNVVTAAKELPDEIAIVDIGYHSAHLNIFAKPDFIMGREISVPNHLLRSDPLVSRTIDMDETPEMQPPLTEDADELADVYGSIAVEVIKILNFYNFSRPAEGSRLQDIYYCGASSQLESLRVSIIKATDMTLHHAQRLLKMKNVDEDLALYCSLAAGAAMQKM